MLLWSVDFDRSGVWRFYATKDLQQSRLAGSILSEECVNFAALHFEVHFFEGENIAETL
jgi:hypothetical protein